MVWGIFLALAAIWAYGLLPHIWADRRTTPSVFPTRRPAGARAGSGAARRADSGSPVPAVAVVDPSERGRVLYRRRRAVLSLTVAVVLSVVTAVLVGGGWLIGSAGAANALLIWYLVRLRRIVKLERSRPVSVAPDHGVPDYEEEVFAVSRVRIVQSR